MNESTGYSENILHAKCMKIFGMVTRRLNETSEGEKSRNPFSPSLPNGTRYWLIRRSSPAAVLLRYYAVTQAGSALEKKIRISISLGNVLILNLNGIFIMYVFKIQ